MTDTSSPTDIHRSATETSAPTRVFGWSDLWLSPEEARDADWNGAVADPAVVAEAWRTWQSEVTSPRASSNRPRTSE